MLSSRVTEEPSQMPIQKFRAAWRNASLGLGALAVLSAAPAHAEDVLKSINLPLAAWTTVALKKGILKEEFEKIGTTEIRLLNPGTAELSGAEAAMLDRGGLAIAQRMMY